MELEDLRIFLAVVRQGTLTGASRELHLSQPALSRRLQRLERALRADLFERSGRRLRLTDAGAHFQRRAEAILAEVSELSGELSSFASGTRGRLRVGATVTSCLYLLPPVFRSFHAGHPQVQVVVRNDTSQRMPDLLHERRIDVGIASVLTAREDVRAIPWKELELVLVRPAGAGHGPVSLKDLGESPMVLPSAGTVRLLTESLFARCEIAPPVAAECDSLEVVKELVAAGFGQAILPRVCLLPEERGFEVAGFLGTLPRLPVAALVPRVRDLPAAVTEFLRSLGVSAGVEP